MKILVDENMPYAEQLFQQLGEVQAIPGRPVPAGVLEQADAFMVRSVTKVNESLLKGSSVKFVGTATAGMDHVDQQWLSQAGIGFSAAPGCNAIAVVEYVFSALMLLAERDQFQLKDKTVGIVGVGNVGGRLADRLAALGVKTLLCDPPRVDRGDEGEFWPLEKLVQEADILTFHTPFNKSGRYQTYHLADAELLSALPDNRILINASRGEVVDNQALLSVLQSGKKLRVVLDVWEPEPNLSLPLLALVDIGTPHIAGYTLEGKARGTTQVFEAYCEFLGQPCRAELSDLLPEPDFSHITVHGEVTQSILKRLIHLVYDVRRDDAPLRQVAEQDGAFDRLRKNYPERREWSSLTVHCDSESSAQLLSGIGFNAKTI
ncbi:4-phosphoerythronate dehydrogenase PdxB [Xenorhabdus bovienii]|uniref:Erythronate-4-phosphate dehydrogenase n=1 Tax=Xenorhabdus bovienii TaxID=40576 RepID=A0AAJ1J5W5_XENBV|nr:4-phosphoerythronate dehydrogenase PdxB [Xenorhabdus bovienii]MDE1473296.1 4-phosphoerythronate dehydrogenase PdxB [Xenorhabdus bovienii]MDE1477735.1 4-phosphoerythronate dehydrogenase PdxB [Xenorhabdus bovienii]MDE1484848.1 4-phosphoerythronate dehydrogenase PdxB [Xenorhabdus bovienii]MDE1489835.1 4-phosphoerythronate dehydrogenase PdxB [Xenorhabdus bovienii]MDE1494153.1 4-phosphoerythronate dehydrogenase PdxB [Xenorhabdus bovienii]